MPIKYRKDGNIEVPLKGGGAVVYPVRLLEDLHASAQAEGAQVTDGEALMRVRFKGEPRIRFIYACRNGECTGVLLQGVMECPVCGTSRPVCPNCLDTRGFLAPTGKPRPHSWGTEWWEKLSWQEYPCVVCRDERVRMVEALRSCGIPEPEVVAARRDDWYQWDVTGRRSFAQAARDFVDRVLSGTPGNLTMVGSHGSGKTSLCEWIVVSLVRAGRRAKYVTSLEFKEAVSDSIDGQYAHPLLEQMRSERVLIFDESSWVREKNAGGNQSYLAEKIRDILDFRYRHKSTHWTILVVKKAVWDERENMLIADMYDRMSEDVVAITDIESIRPYRGTVMQDAQE